MVPERLLNETGISMNNDQNRQVVISVGQCGFDNSRIRSLLNSVNSSIVFLTADTGTELDQLLVKHKEKVQLVLLNRVFDSDGTSGVAVIQQITTSGASSLKPPMMLVSNYEASQAEAIAHGALPGFGKSALNSAETRQRLESILCGASN